MQNTLTETDAKALMELLAQRFHQNEKRHPNISWQQVADRLWAKPQKLWPLAQMERSGGEPDVVGQDTGTGEFLFFDCATESPKGRRSLCYDREALEARKEHKPVNCAKDVATDMGTDLLTEAEYRHLQTLGVFDTKTSSWIQTPDKVRNLGGALFCDRRYDTVFTYHNGAESYYAARGFRASLRV